ncbi:DUF3006 domain-containing protein [Peribacillus huizhouensis]|uniref:DUF3006 domain-containing protein n=1 Tax=Peribacillus huizhouensis TaxID=1501239 RepID=A0ABR6CMM0_9BACI|nr:DUF3006 domain-containing protein [Peribacillus huizhouensis]MBA9026169.1 hypothetical protein [Peribacillus huizhouensis]
MKGIIDRFEGDLVVVEVDGKTINVPKKLVDSKVKVSDVVELVNEKWMANEAETEKRRKKIKSIMESVWED